MIIPRKHISFSESLLGLGAIILGLFVKPTHVDDLWQGFEKINNTQDFPAYQSFDNFILALDLLYMLGLVELEADGRICRAST